MLVRNQSTVDPRSLLLNRPVGIENLDICRECGGKCCQQFSGYCWPWDFGEPLYDNIRAALESGYYVLDYWHGKFSRNLTKPYWVQPRQKNGLDCLVNSSTNGVCIFWRKLYGCQLQFERRPTTCRMLTPFPDFDSCQPPRKYDKRQMAISWLPFQFILQTLIDEYRTGELKLKKVRVDIQI